MFNYHHYSTKKFKIPKTMISDAYENYFKATQGNLMTPRKLDSEDSIFRTYSKQLNHKTGRLIMTVRVNWITFVP